MSVREWLEIFSINGFVFEHTWILPAMEVVHYTGHSLTVGAIIYLDLRLLGINKNFPVKKLSTHIIPLSGLGLMLALLSGTGLFLSDVDRFWANPALKIKLILITIALVNIAVFHFDIFRNVDSWDQDIGPPLSARLGGFFSIVFWLAAIISGRLIAYF